MSKSSFFTGQPIFGQILNLIPRSLIIGVARDLQADRYCKRFSSYDHLVTMLYSVYNNCHSLREVSTGMLAWEQRLNHLGINHYPRRSTISDANNRRKPQFFEQVYLKLLSKYGKVLSDSRGDTRHQKKLYVFDSTTISLFQEVLRGAGIRSLNGKRKGGIKVHTLLKSDQDVPAMIRFSPSSRADSTFLKEVKLPVGSIIVFDRGYNHYPTLNRFTADQVSWVTRLRQDAVYDFIEQRPLDKLQKGKGILKDQEVILGHHHDKNSTKVRARLISYKDPETKKKLEFLTNNFRMAPATIADLYGKRWQIEVLFKRLKQNYPLKYFLGDSENAIQIQIWCSLIADLILKVIKKGTARKWSFSNLTSIVRLHLMTYIDLNRFLKSPEKALYQKIKNKDLLNKNLSLFPT
jgi:IS4 transposase